MRLRSPHYLLVVGAFLVLLNPIRVFFAVKWLVLKHAKKALLWSEENFFTRHAKA
jgi:hypothetical protein